MNLKAQIKFHENTTSHTPVKHRLVGDTSQFSQFPQGDPGGIATMWIDTAGTLPAGSQLTVAAKCPIIMPRPHRFMLHSPVQPTLVQICFAI
ncbi:hypothetical protein BASA50_010731 [Batrachochytrium salamandrivorans]|uniref:Uncharacterized protein n=1 Tax=Batrachochytrium salamandrivorans TaxID=1357716 RepID=A0ABQ8EXM5_9FUNG|nr:hypothetical protein BASA50_010731 [Batrachochytrium salamandrivorans]